MTQVNSEPRYPVIVIGAGIGGLAASILLAQNGHSVTVLERRSTSYISNSSGGLALWKNAQRILTGAVGLALQLREISDDAESTLVLDYATGETVTRLKSSKGTSMVHRADLLRIMYERALELGVNIKLGQEITVISEENGRVTVSVQDANRYDACLVIGADGIESQTRRILFPDKDVSSRATGDCKFLVNASREVMMSHPETAKLWTERPYHFSSGAGRSTVSWVMKDRQVYHLQLNDHTYKDGAHYGLGGVNSAVDGWVQTYTDMPAIQRQWRDFSPGIRHILSSTESCIAWRIAQVPSLDRWSSLSGRIVLLGDAAHGFPPFAGQGACTTLEDAAVLARLVSLASSADDLPRIAQAYYETRRERVDILLEVIWDNIRAFSQHPEVTQRIVENVAALQDIRRQRKAKGEWIRESMRDETGKYTTDKRAAWLGEYRAVEEAEHHWQTYFANYQLRPKV